MSFFVIFKSTLKPYFKIKYKIIVAIENLKKVNVKGGIYGAESFAAINAPAQKKHDKSISP